MSNIESKSDERFIAVDPEFDALYLSFIESIDLSKYSPYDVIGLSKKAWDDSMKVIKCRDIIDSTIRELDPHLIEVLGPEGDIIPVCEPIEHLQRLRTAFEYRLIELQLFRERCDDYLDSLPKAKTPKPPSLSVDQMFMFM
jgi:hypothetical protein